ncbi:hypothetical protein AEM42_13335 [Betaproteobacteria bacterium UKL13-2]|nr:hypothetical protein AEM42_13335 [Betaproteobacteria bacterium UKL13-2]HCG52717.1 hypothetical protein [Betaproteobacteria bacterium]
MASSREAASRGVADRIILESPDFYAVSSIGGFIRGWVLICTKQHHLNLKSSYGRADFWAFAERVADLVRSEFGPTVMFEHGANAEGSSTACGSNHAHLHIVPFAGNLEALALQSEVNLSWMPSTANEIAVLANDSEYLFCANRFNRGETNGQLALIERPTSQFFRRVLADAVGLPNLFDYKVNRFEEFSADTAHRLTQVAQAVS